MNLNNTVIKALNAEHGKQIVQFYKLNGFDSVYNHDGTATGTYYGVINNVFDCWLPNVLKKKQLTTPINIIELPEEYIIPEVPIGKLMYVSNMPFDKTNSRIYKRFVIGKRNNYYFAWRNSSKEEGIKEESSIYGWRYAMFISETNPKKEKLLNKIDELKTQIKELEEQVENI